IELVNIAGQVVHTINNSASYETISLNNIQAGTYMLRIVKDDIIHIEKLVITK
ncbi:MAG: T9SS type A sorting domain-containing protein, partial [Bacteroidales bacterium]|nr:T9SS type A sorting domain-containing protein [Bacteroidales bacterium]